MLKFLYRCLTLKEDKLSNVSVWIATLCCLAAFTTAIVTYAKY